MPQSKQGARSKQGTASSEFVTQVSDQKTTLFIKKVLSVRDDGKNNDEAHLQEVLPPLTSSNTIDLQLYAFIAIIIQENVNSWYNHLTSDKDFVSQIVQIVAHCTRALEQRTRRVDVNSMVFNDIAGLVDAHIQSESALEHPSTYGLHPPVLNSLAFRFAQRATDSKHASSSVEGLYHSLRPHPALSKLSARTHNVENSQDPDPEYRHLLATGILALLLPDEDVRNPCLLALVSDVLADLVLGEVFAKRISNPAFIYEGMCKVAQLVTSRLVLRPWMVESSDTRQSRLQGFGLLSSTHIEVEHQQDTGTKAIGMTLQIIGRFILIALLGLHNLVLSLVAASSLPSRQYYGVSLLRERSRIGDHHREHKDRYYGRSDLEWEKAAQPCPVLALNAWSTIANITRTSQHLPFICDLALSLQRLALVGPGQVGCTNTPLDR